MAGEIKPKQDRKRHPAANGGKWLRPEKRLAIYLRDGFLCAYCLRNLADAPANQRTIDHVIPVKLGGTNHEDNLCLACKKCNDTKQDRSAWEFLARDLQPTNATTTAAFVHRRTRLLRLLDTPINRILAKTIITGTLDLSDVLKEQTQ